MFRLAKDFLTSLFSPTLPNNKRATLATQHPFMQAVASGNLFEISKYTIYADFDPNITDEAGNSAAILAASNNQAQVLNILKNHGADLNQTGEKGVTPLIAAAYEGCLQAVQYLVQQQAHLEDSVDGNTALMWAVSQNHLQIVATLLHAGAMVNARNNMHNTALHIAAEQGNADIASMLIEAGADQLCVGMNGMTPAMVAEACGHQHVLDLMAPHQWPPTASLADQDDFDQIIWPEEPQAFQIEAPYVEFDSEHEGLEGSEDDDFPDHLIDPVSREPFETPITLPNGQTYDRKTLVELFQHANRHSPGVVKCPLTNDLITRDVLNIKPNIVIKNAVEEARRQLAAAREASQADRKRPREESVAEFLQESDSGASVRQKRLAHFGSMFAQSKSAEDGADNGQAMCPKFN